MPPKKKVRTKKKPGKNMESKGPVLIDGFPLSEMSKEQLEGHVKTLLEKVSRERKERADAQLERDRLATVWETKSKQMEEFKAECRVKGGEMQEAEQRYMIAMKELENRMKHQEIYLGELRTENMNMREEHQCKEQLFLIEKQDLMDKVQDQEKQFQVMLQDSNGGENDNQRKQFEEKVQALEKNYSIKYESLTAELRLKLKAEFSAAEERKKAEIEELEKKHEVNFAEIKKFYNDITLSNLAMINNLKEEIKTKEFEMERNEELFNSVKDENRKLEAPLLSARDEISELKRRCGDRDKIKAALMSYKARLKISHRMVENLNWEIEVIHRRLESSIRDNSSMQTKYSDMISEMQKKSGAKYLILEKKVAAMQEELDIKEAQLNAFVSGPAAENESALAMAKVRDVVKEKCDKIGALENEINGLRNRRPWAGESTSSDDIEFQIEDLDFSDTRSVKSFSLSSSSSSIPFF